MGSWVLLICWTCCALKTSLSSVLTQSPGLLHVSVGDTFQVKCIHEIPVMYCYSTTTWHRVDWRTGELKKLSTSSWTPNTNPENNGKTCSLTISKATLQDSGMYYCTGLLNTVILFGNGTRVIVTDPARLDPSIIMYSPSDISGPIIPLQCLVMGAAPSQVQVFWNINQIEHEGWTELSWAGNSDSSQEYTRAYITVSKEVWTEADWIECVAVSEGKTISKRLVKRGVCSWYLFLGFGVAFLTIAVATTVAVRLYKGIQRTNSRIMKPTAERRTWTVVEYSCWNHDNPMFEPLTET
ncbi:immunoglobulin kappa light chain-like [Salminus brasiliensis]|uniref:immunoglobulin kappa light chain-like n=1 Tax=Salminus brasiliensis TaxID=930266 RepID=UPI003B83094B